jgi:phosphatidylcholine synthase
VFLLLAAAVLVDATDGALARRARVKEVLPQFDGTRLDDIVDYLNYAFVPAFFAWRQELFPRDFAFAVAALPVLASAYGFCQAAAKTPDHFFTGFPSYWNVVVYYLYVLELPAWANAAVVAVLAVLVFVPTAYLYPSRSPVLQTSMLFFGGIWGATVFYTILELPEPTRPLVWASLAYPVYYLVASVRIHFRRREGRS